MRTPPACELGVRSHLHQHALVIQAASSPFLWFLFTASAFLAVSPVPATSEPLPLGYHAMAYDSSRGVTVLFGGYDGTNARGETWEWDGIAWTRASETGPSPRTDHAMAYDSAREVTVLFGGYSHPSYMDDTWEWNGTTWTLRTNSGPSNRLAHDMVYDSNRGVTVLFGGFTGPGQHNGQTWEWDGTTWLLRSSSGPSPRGSHAMAYDSSRGVTVLFGGYGGGGQRETWEWSGTAWSLQSTTGPAGREHHAMVYDSQRGVTVLFGGDWGGAYYNDTWEWNGVAWLDAASSSPVPSPRRVHAMAYDCHRGLTVLYGGYDGTQYSDETWEWSGTAWSEKVPPWTVMIYLDGDNDLEDEAIADFLEMAEVDNPHVNIVVQFDRAAGGDPNFGDWTTTKRFHVTHGMEPTAANQVEDIGEANMAAPATLTAFINWARTNYPAQHYALVLWNHGDGWRAPMGANPLFKGICVDGGDSLLMQELRQALDDATNSGANPIDVISMDACLMGGLEVAYEIKEYARYFAASAELVPGDGCEYQVILDPVYLSATTTPEVWAENVVSAYRDHYDVYNENPTFMAARTSAVGPLSAAVSDLASVLISNMATERSNIESARASARRYTDEPSSSGNPYYEYVIDLYDFCRDLQILSSNTNIENACLAVRQWITDDLLANWWADLDYPGTTFYQRCFWIYFPPDYTGQYATDRDNYNGSYLSFLSDPNQRWDEFLNLYLVPKTLALNVVNQAWGAVDIDPNLLAYEGGTPVTLTAIPIEGKAFRHWRIFDPNFPGDSNYAVLDSNLSTTIVMMADREITAVFKCGSSVAPLLPVVLGLLGLFVWIRRIH